MSYQCWQCGSIRSQVISTQETKRTVRRQRRCRACTAVWSTYEITQPEHEFIENLKALASDARKLTDRIESALLHLDARQGKVNGALSHDQKRRSLHARPNGRDV